MSGEMEGDAAAQMKLRLRSDIQAAMKAKRAAESSVLRLLVGAIDQAGAVPANARDKSALGYRFGDPAAEVARRVLSAEDVQAVIRKERDEIQAVADQLATSGHSEAAAEHRAKVALIEQYLRQA